MGCGSGDPLFVARNFEQGLFSRFCCQKFLRTPLPPIKPIEKMRFSKKCKNTSKIREKRLSGQGWGGVPKFRENHFFSLKRALGLFCPIYSNKQLRKKSGALQSILKIFRKSDHRKNTEKMKKSPKNSKNQKCPKIAM